MKKQTAVQMILEYLKKHGFDMEYEIQMSFLDHEEQQLKESMMYALDEDGHTGDWKVRFVDTYYEQMFKNKDK